MNTIKETPAPTQVTTNKSPLSLSLVTMKDNSETVTLPSETIIKSETVETEFSKSENTEFSPTTKSISSAAAGSVGGLENVAINEVNDPVQILKGENIKPHLFDGVSKTSEQELISFIQNLMQQAKEEHQLIDNELVTNDNIIIGKEPSKSSVLRTETTTLSTSTTTTTTETAPTLPFRTTLRTTTALAPTTTTTDGSPTGVITRLLSEAAAPIAGLSAATLAYSAAAMLPVWLPAALGRKKRSVVEHSQNNYPFVKIFHPPPFSEK